MNITDQMTKLFNIVTAEKQELDSISSIVKREEKEIIAATVLFILSASVVIGKRYVWPYCKKKFSSNTPQDSEVGRCNMNAQQVAIQACEVKIYGMSSDDQRRNEEQGDDVIDPSQVAVDSNVVTQQQHPNSNIDNVHNPEEVPLRMNV